MESDRRSSQVARWEHGGLKQHFWRSTTSISDGEASIIQAPWSDAKFTEGNRVDCVLVLRIRTTVLRPGLFQEPQWLHRTFPQSHVDDEVRNSCANSLHGCHLVV